jgi:hypothetical protein
MMADVIIGSTGTASLHAARQLLVHVLLTMVAMQFDDCGGTISRGGVALASTLAQISTQHLPCEHCEHLLSHRKSLVQGPSFQWCHSAESKHNRTPVHTGRPFPAESLLVGKLRNGKQTAIVSMLVLAGLHMRYKHVLLHRRC